MPPHERFTNHLLETLNSSRQRVQEYVDRMKLEVDQQVDKYKETILVEEESYRIQQNELFSVQEELSSDEGVRQKRRTAEEHNRQLEERLVSLQNEIRIRERIVDELKEEERQTRIKAKDAMEHKARVEESKNTTIDDLTRGIINYKYLGFDFVKANGNGLRFSFTHLDAGDPKRMFTFVLRANPNDVYEVDECSAAIDPKTLQTLLTNLNDTDDLASFMMGMRRAFSVTL